MELFVHVNCFRTDSEVIIILGMAAARRVGRPNARLRMRTKSMQTLNLVMVVLWLLFLLVVL